MSNEAEIHNPQDLRLLGIFDIVVRYLMHQLYTDDVTIDMEKFQVPYVPLGICKTNDNIIRVILARPDETPTNNRLTSLVHDSFDLHIRNIDAEIANG